VQIRKEENYKIYSDFPAHLYYRCFMIEAAKNEKIMHPAPISSFAQNVYDYLRTIPYGKVVTYGQIAKALGHPRAARAVGQILHANPDFKMYPCFKVVNAKGQLSKHYAFGGLAEQKKLLEQEGIKVQNGCVDLAIYQWNIEQKK
jgi:O-6-methylguanine DNA methyltransferase